MAVASSNYECATEIATEIHTLTKEVRELRAILFAMLITKSGSENTEDAKADAEFWMREARAMLK